MKRLFASAAYAAALALLLATTARAAAARDIKSASGNQPAAVEGIVVPDSIHDRQPFSFAATHAVTGEVVSVQTLEGVVVERSSADKYGRVFMAAGLPAGAYLISSSGQPIGKIEIKQVATDALERPWLHPAQPMQILQSPQFAKASDSLILTGRGFSPNCADMQVMLASKGQTQSVPVLAATEDQLKLAPLQQLPPGAAQLRVSNQATGDSTAHDLLLYTIRGNLVRRAVARGDQTQLVITTRPENEPLKVKVMVASGPVDFGDGRREAEAVTSNGRAIFPVRAEHGAGPFQLTWELVPTPVSRSH